jgi:hypothetical protein
MAIRRANAEMSGKRRRCREENEVSTMEEKTVKEAER